MPPLKIRREVLPPRLWPSVTVTGWSVLTAVTALTLLAYLILLIATATT